jgi:epoxyqueuosine reductase
MNTWTNRLVEKAIKAEFPLASLIDIDLAGSTEFDRYQDWINQGFHGEMKYLERGLDRRKNPRLLLADAESILCLAIPYRRNPPVDHHAGQPQYARYLQGHDYHERLKEKLETLMQDFASENHFESELRWKVCVDTSAVLERSWATLAGLGWIGKNSLLIHPQYGSYLFLAEVLINQKSGQGPKPLPNYCGSCTRCLTGCPTQALVQPGVLNSNDCISYLTLEKRGAWDKSDEFKKKMGLWVAGCDICQEVCPFNIKPARWDETWPVTDHDRAALETDWSKLEKETETEYKDRIKNSALERIKFLDFKRNIANAKNNCTN